LEKRWKIGERVTELKNPHECEDFFYLRSLSITFSNASFGRAQETISYSQVILLIRTLPGVALIQKSVFPPSICF
jgi:hypothetical protein